MRGSKANCQRWNRTMIIFLSLLCLSSFPMTYGFLAASTAASSTRRPQPQTSTQLDFNRFGAFGDFLNLNRTQAANDFMSDDEEPEDTAAGTFRIVTLPVRAIKPGGLRLFLMFYLAGMQNTPDPQSWKAEQPSRDEYVVDMYFRDHSAVLSVELDEDAHRVTIDRVGSAPSTQYLMQESIIVQGVLDELELCAKDDTIAVKDRLLILQEEDSIEKARNTLAFG